MDIELYSAGAQIAVVLALALVLEARQDARRAVRNRMGQAYKISITVWWGILAVAISVAFLLSLNVLAGFWEPSVVFAGWVATSLSIAFGGVAVGVVGGAVMNGYFGADPDD